MSKAPSDRDDSFDDESPEVNVDASVGDFDFSPEDDIEGNYSSEEDSDLNDINDEYADLAINGDQDLDDEELSSEEHYYEDFAEDGDLDEEELEGDVKSLDFDEDQAMSYGYGDDPNGYEDDED